MAPMFDFLFPPPPSIFVTAMTVTSFAALVFFGVSELRGKHLQYSKFWNATPAASLKEIRISSRAGMFFLYAPAAAAAAASFAVPGLVAGDRSRLVAAALAVHFVKRVFEVLFIHRYSGHIILDSAIPISFSYFISAVTMIYAQYLSQNMAEPTFNLKCPGVVLFLIGIIGNFYHHYLLANLRKKDEKDYKIPRGGLFGFVICPHYLFEIIGFVGISLIAQTVYSLSFALGTIIYLTGRSYATHKWYVSKFEDFPRHVKALIPFVF